MIEITSTLVEITVAIAIFVVYINIGTLLIAAVVGDINSSPFITIFCLTLANCISSIASSVMADYFGVVNLEFMRHLWYVSLACINIITIIFIYKLHSYYHKRLGKLANTVVLSSMILVIVQMIEYVPRILFNISSKELDDLKMLGVSFSSFYPNAITVINVFLTVVTVLVVFFALLKAVKVRVYFK